MTNSASPTSLLPLTQEQMVRLQAATHDFSAQQLIWLSGYFWGQASIQSGNLPLVNAPATVASGVDAVAITLISASQTGNARRVAEQLRDDLLAAQLTVNLINAGDYPFKRIAQAKVLLIITSTQGEGEVPEEAIALQKFLFSKKAPTLSDTQFAVLSLGDSSYDKFCQAGKDFDQRLAELGATRLLDRIDADIDYQVPASAWRQEIVSLLQVTLLQSRLPVTATHPAAAISPTILATRSRYDKQHPYPAQLSARQKITSRNSDKDVRHLEIDLGDSALTYQPGDALGIWFENDLALVKELLDLLWLTGDEVVTVAEQSMPLTEALQTQFELTQNTRAIVERYAGLSRSSSLLALLADKAQLQQYAHHTPIVDMVREAPTELTAEQLVTLLRPLTPRLYSIASAQAEVGNEVHITVGVVRYSVNGHPRSGGASGYLADHLPVEGEVRVFIEPNHHFRLPADPTTPVIMIGPGTGIAPFRAFMQQREAEGAAGQNWLFFGNPHFTDDFLYQLEWQRYVKQGLLTRIDLAWSRDQAQKVYVQDKLRQQGAEVWRWLQQGAHIYVCGDANRMAHDVEQTLLQLVAEHGAMDAEQADDFLSELRQQRRYQRDVY